MNLGGKVNMNCTPFISFLFVILNLNTLAAAEYFIEPPNGRTYEIHMLDPVIHRHDDFSGIVSFFQENGYVVVDQVSEKNQRENLVKLIDQLIQKDIPHSRRVGFLDLYHDDRLAQLRQNPRIYNVFSKILGTEKLWVVFDRVIFQDKNESEDPLNPHVDQNPVANPGFSNVQAMIALRDMNESTGTLALVPQSHLFFDEYAKWVKPGDGYVEHQGERALSFVGLRLREGQLVIWDSRTTHSRFRGEAKTNRYAALVTFTYAKDDPELTALRLKYFHEGTGWNCHAAGLRATARPRCEISLRQNPEDLTPLGRKLYGLESWFEQ